MIAYNNSSHHVLSKVEQFSSQSFDSNHNRTSHCPIDHVCSHQRDLCANGFSLGSRAWNLRLRQVPSHLFIVPLGPPMYFTPHPPTPNLPFHSPVPPLSVL